MTRILLVDDDRIFSSITKKSCMEAGIVIDTVNSFKAMKHQNLSAYDGLLVDYDLRDGTGEQVIEFLKQNKIEKPIALISSTDREIFSLPTHGEAPIKFISKWQSADALIEVLKNFVPDVPPLPKSA